MSKIIGYVILDTDSPNRLTAAVDSHIQDGWLPLGGVSVANIGVGSTLYAQAMVKYDPTYIPVGVR